MDAFYTMIEPTLLDKLKYYINYGFTYIYKITFSFTLIIASIFIGLKYTTGWWNLLDILLFYLVVMSILNIVHLVTYIFQKKNYKVYFDEVNNITELDKKNMNLYASYTNEGYLKVRTIIGRSGIFEEPGFKFHIVKPKNLKDEDSLLSLKGKPVVMGHPDTKLTRNPTLNAAAYKKYTVGRIDKVGEVYKNWLIAEFTITNKSAIGHIESGMHELSVGYNSHGEFYNKTKYGINIKRSHINMTYLHLGIVEKGAAGPVARIYL